MAFAENRSNWLSAIIEEHRRPCDRWIPLDERKAERDAIVAAIRGHPDGKGLAAIPNLADIVWAALGEAYHWEQEAQRNPHLPMTPPAVHASWLIVNMARRGAE
jgi:hypothetical protein